MKIKNLSLPFLGFLQATGLFIYITLIAQVLINANKIFAPVGSFLGPMAFLLLFVVSAIISGFLVLARAGFLFWEKRYTEAFTLVGWTLVWSVLYLIVVFLILFISNSQTILHQQ